MDLKARLNEKVGPYHEVVTLERVLRFFQAVTQGEVPRAIDSLPSELPPTFLTVCRLGEFELLQKFGVSLSQVLHGEQEYQYYRTLRLDTILGSELQYETSLVQSMEKKGKQFVMTFLVFETKIYIPKKYDNELVAQTRSNLIVRGNV